MNMQCNNTKCVYFFLCHVFNFKMRFQDIFIVYDMFLVFYDSFGFQLTGVFFNTILYGQFGFL